MRMYDLILKKRNGGKLSDSEIRDMIKAYVDGEIPDYQMSAMCMAIYYKGMDNEEISCLTMAMAESGDMVDLSEIPGIKVDKHSTGGVGDKTTMIITPIVAACGIPVAKMSGRGLGHTGGTIDKLESIPGFRTDLNQEEFFAAVKRNGLAVIGQSGNITPADKKLYALRDVTATVDSIPLIASSVMSKKIAAGSDCILLDVTTGSGAFMKTVEDSVALSRVMVDIGWSVGRPTAALITNMNIPTGFHIGNILEVKEAIETLKGNGPEDLTAICTELAANMLNIANKGSIEDCRNMAKIKIEDGSALEAFAGMVESQGGDKDYIYNPDRFDVAPFRVEIKSDREGYITFMNTEGIGISSTMLGAGRETKEDQIDYSAGIVLKKKTGDKVSVGDTLAVFHTSKEDLIENARVRFLESLEIKMEVPEPQKHVYARVTKDQVEYY